LLENRRANVERALTIAHKILDYTIRQQDRLNMALCHQKLACTLTQAGKYRNAEKLVDATLPLAMAHDLGSDTCAV
jgi:hypothetical protein